MWLFPIRLASLQDSDLLEVHCKDMKMESTTTTTTTFLPATTKAQFDDYDACISLIKKMTLYGINQKQAFDRLTQVVELYTYAQPPVSEMLKILRNAFGSEACNFSANYGWIPTNIRDGAFAITSAGLRYQPNLWTVKDYTLAATTQAMMFGQVGIHKVRYPVKFNGMLTDFLDSIKAKKVTPTDFNFYVGGKYSYFSAGAAAMAANGGIFNMSANTLEQYTAFVPLAPFVKFLTKTYHAQAQMNAIGSENYRKMQSPFGDLWHSSTHVDTQIPALNPGANLTPINNVVFASILSDDLERYVQFTGKVDGLPNNLANFLTTNANYCAIIPIDSRTMPVQSRSFMASWTALWCGNQMDSIVRTNLNIYRSDTGVPITHNNVPFYTFAQQAYFQLPIPASPGGNFTYLYVDVANVATQIAYPGDLNLHWTNDVLTAAFAATTITDPRVWDYEIVAYDTVLMHNVMVNFLVHEELVVWAYTIASNIVTGRFNNGLARVADAGGTERDYEFGIGSAHGDAAFALHSTLTFRQTSHSLGQRPSFKSDGSFDWTGQFITIPHCRGSEAVLWAQQVNTYPLSGVEFSRSKIYWTMYGLAALNSSAATLQQTRAELINQMRWKNLLVPFTETAQLEFFDKERILAYGLAEANKMTILPMIPVRTDLVYGLTLNEISVVANNNVPSVMSKWFVPGDFITLAALWYDNTLKKPLWGTPSVKLVSFGVTDSSTNAMVLRYGPAEGRENSFNFTQRMMWRYIHNWNASRVFYTRAGLVEDYTSGGRYYVTDADGMNESSNKFSYSMPVPGRVNGRSFKLVLVTDLKYLPAVKQDGELAMDWTKTDFDIPSDVASTISDAEAAALVN